MQPTKAKTMTVGELGLWFSLALVIIKIVVIVASIF